MFSKDKPTDKLPTGNAALISAGTVVQGDLSSQTDLRIDGTIHGNVTCKAKVIIGPDGLVEGSIQSAQADVAGKVVGNISVSDLAQLRAKSNLQGNITALSLQIEAGAIFNGQSTMTSAAAGNVVHMKEGETVHAKAK